MAESEFKVKFDDETVREINEFIARDVGKRGRKAARRAFTDVQSWVQFMMDQMADQVSDQNRAEKFKKAGLQGLEQFQGLTDEEVQYLLSRHLPPEAPKL